MVALSVAGAAGGARASAPPVGPLPKGPVTTIRVERGLLFAIALPRPANGLTWRGARPSDWTIARPVDEGEPNGNLVFTYRAGRAGATTVVYALTRGETEHALQARYFDVVVFDTRCSATAEKAALAVVPPKPFVARVQSVKRKPLASGTQRLYAVQFLAVKGNAVLPSGHVYTQFAYVVRRGGQWCFVRGGSGP